MKKEGDGSNSISTRNGEEGGNREEQRTGELKPMTIDKKSRKT